MRYRVLAWPVLAAWLVVAVAVLTVAVYAAAGVTPWGLVAEAWRTVFGTVAPAR